METLLAVVVVTLFPLAVVLAPLLLAGWVERRRAAVIARQVELTEAIHRDLGAVVAPFVTRRPGGRWRVRIAVPFERLAVVEARVPRQGTPRRDSPRCGGATAGGSPRRRGARRARSAGEALALRGAPVSAPRAAHGYPSRAMTASSWHFLKPYAVIPRMPGLSSAAS